MASHGRELVVGEPYCYTWIHGIDESEDSIQSTHFVMYIKATIRRQQPRVSEEVEEEDAEIEEHFSVNDATMELQFDPDSTDMGILISNTLSGLHIPLQAHPPIVAEILYKAYSWATDNDSYFPPSREVFHMGVYVEVSVYQTYLSDIGDTDMDVSDTGDTDMDVSDIGDTDMDVEDGGDEPQFVPASKSSIEELERTIVETSTMCSICREEMMVGSEATRMPCSHLYHGDCIVKWLQRSRICPLCRYSMPADE
ncbi:probable E3 ubiquitin-protein ligase RHC2A [Pyrus communis]|uniref:probable E3 ubiquitin-protein ligase RHC2A n=1 Tax=Pyrus communis TaxID=23211 RepID=UPI0035BFA1BA